MHCIVELYGCPEHLLNDREFVQRTLREAAAQGLSTLITDVAHQFTPQGVTALGLLAESHIAIHTWPEHRYAAADVFTCGHRADPVRACEYLVRAFRARSHSLRTIPRGMPVTPSASAGNGTAASAGRPDTVSSEPLETDPCPALSCVPTSG